MKNNQIWHRIFVLCITSFGMLTMAQTGIKITYFSGVTQDYTVETSGKLYFSGNNLLLKTSATANVVTVPTGIIRKITFTSASLATQETVRKDSDIRLYPNPSSDLIRISASTGKPMTVRIYSATGRLLLKGDYKPNEDIDISSLATGFYLVQVDQTTLKMIKK